MARKFGDFIKNSVVVSNQRQRSTRILSMAQMRFFLVLASILFGVSVYANPNSGITYHGRIVKPDGQPLQGMHVQFRLQIRTPGSENCLLYEEVQSKDMRNSNGLFALTINDGTGTRGTDIVASISSVSFKTVALSPVYRIAKVD